MNLDTRKINSKESEIWSSQRWLVI